MLHTVLGIDLGTQHLKVVFYDFESRRLAAVESAPLDVYRGHAGVAEQEAHWWVNALRDALAKVGQDVRASVRAIGVSGQQHGFVPIDRSGEVLAPVKLWCDTSTEPECEQVMNACGGAAACVAEAGNAVLPGYTASKVSWFRRAHPSLYRRMDCVLLPHDYLNFFLTGERCMEMGDASGTGFLDVRNRRWSDRILRAIDPERDLRECLPPLRTANEAIGTLLQTVATLLGLPAGVPVAIGGGDNMMAAIGTGNVVPGKLTMSLGTSGTVYAYSPVPVVDESGSIAAFCSSTGGWLPLLCTMNCTVSTELARGLFGLTINEFEGQIAAAARGSGGILTLPFFNGERTPNLPNAKGCIVGVDSRNASRENLLRSAVEGATFALRSGVDALSRLGIQSREIVLTGGGVKSATWRQVVADVCGLPVTVLEQEEGAAYGAALQALALLDGSGTGPLEALVARHLGRDEARCCEPVLPAVEFYANAYQDFRKTVEAIAVLYA